MVRKDCQRQKKTVEVRKTKPKLKPPFKCYIYCTKDKNNHFWTGKRYSYADDHSHNAFDKIGSGKIIGEFICNQIYELAPLNHAPDDVEQQACLTREEIVWYLKGVGYGWHISDLKIYDKPKELRSFWKADKCPYATESGCTYKYHCFRAGQTQRCGETLTRPPQSWCYVEVMQDG